MTGSKVERIKVKTAIYQLGKACGANVPGWWVDKVTDEICANPDGETAALLRFDFSAPRNRAALRAWFKRMQAKGRTPGWDK